MFVLELVWHTLPHLSWFAKFDQNWNCWGKRGHTCLLLTVFRHIWTCEAICDHIVSFLAILKFNWSFFGHTCPYLLYCPYLSSMAILGHTCSYYAILGHTWPYYTMFCFAILAIFGHTSPWLSILGHKWLYWTIIGHTGLCYAILG